MADPKKARPEVNALVTELLDRLAQSDVRDLEVRRNGIRVRVSRGASPASPAPAPTAAQRPAPTAQAASPVATSPTTAGPPEVLGPQVKAPLTGIFYRSPSPQAPPFVQVGQVISTGEVVALIEAMKLFNEIRSTAGGKVKRIFAENGQLVRAHQPLLELEPI